MIERYLHIKEFQDFPRVEWLDFPTIHYGTMNLTLNLSQLIRLLGMNDYNLQNETKLFRRYFLFANTVFSLPPKNYFVARTRCLYVILFLRCHKNLGKEA